MTDRVFRRGTPERAQLVAAVTDAVMDAGMADTVLTEAQGVSDRYRRLLAARFLRRAEKALRAQRENLLS